MSVSEQYMYGELSLNSQKFFKAKRQKLRVSVYNQGKKECVKSA